MSSDLYSINTQLMGVQRLMGSYQLQISKKREEISRLEKAVTDLELTKTDFYETENVCSKPEFTSKSFHGDHAKDVTSLRNDELRPYFASIPDEQITKATEKMKVQIKLFQEQIGNLENNITSLESQKRTLIARKQEVKSQK